MKKVEYRSKHEHVIALLRRMNSTTIQNVSLWEHALTLFEYHLSLLFETDYSVRRPSTSHRAWVSTQSPIIWYCHTVHRWNIEDLACVYGVSYYTLQTIVKQYRRALSDTTTC